MKSAEQPVPPRDDKTSALDHWSFYLFVFGILGPLLLGLGVYVVAASTNAQLADEVIGGLLVGLFVLCQALALICGIAGPKTTVGKIGLRGSAWALVLLILLMLINMIVYALLWPAALP